MNNFNTSASLKSTKVAQILIYLFYLRIGFAILSLLFNLIQLALPPIYKLISVFDGLQSIIGAFVILSSVIVLFVWNYRVHMDLKDIFSDYPITPGGALARFIIPIYSVWGIHNTLHNFAETFKKELGDLTKLGEKVNSLIVPLYAFTITSNYLARTVSSSLENGDSQDNGSLVFILLLCVMEIGLSFTLLELTKTMRTALIQKFKRAKA